MLGAAVTCVQSVNHDDEVRIQIMTMFLFQYCYPYLAKRYPVKVPVQVPYPIETVGRAAEWIIRIVSDFV